MSATSDPSSRTPADARAAAPTPRPLRRHPLVNPWLGAIRRRPSAILFAVQMAGLFIYPLLGNTTIGRAIFNAIGLAVVLLALWSVRVSPGLTWVGILLAMPAAALLTVGIFIQSTNLQAASSAFEALLYIYAAGCMLAYMLADHRITTDELWAVGSTFTLVAWAFAHAYLVVQALAPNSFTAAVTPEEPRTWVELLFLSVTTLTSTGLSDIVPIRPVARAVVMIEQILGLGYVVMLVSRVVGLTILHGRMRPGEDQQDKPQSTPE